MLASILVLWHLEHQLTRQAQQPLIEQNRRAVLLMTANALLQSMWSLDERSIHQVAQRALDKPAVSSLRLTERRPLTASTVLARAEEAPLEGVSLQSTTLHEGQTLGELELGFDPARVDRLLADRRLATLQWAGLQMLLSMAVLNAVLYRRRLAPIGWAMPPATLCWPHWRNDGGQRWRSAIAVSGAGRRRGLPPQRRRVHRAAARRQR